MKISDKYLWSYTVEGKTIRPRWGDSPARIASTMTDNEILEVLSCVADGYDLSADLLQAISIASGIKREKREEAAKKFREAYFMRAKAQHNEIVAEICDLMADWPRFTAMDVQRVAATTGRYLVRTRQMYAVHIRKEVNNEGGRIVFYPGQREYVDCVYGHDHKPGRQVIYCQGGYTIAK